MGFVWLVIMSLIMMMVAMIKTIITINLVMIYILMTLIIIQKFIMDTITIKNAVAAVTEDEEIFYLLRLVQSNFLHVV